MAIQRRVYRPELRAALGYGDTWFRVLQRRGVIPKGRTDPGGKREWYTEEEAAKIINDLTAAATQQAAA